LGENQQAMGLIGKAEEETTALKSSERNSDKTAITRIEARAKKLRGQVAKGGMP
jgi:hypothetical protein